MQVSVSEAKINMSKLIDLIETGKEEQIIITKYGKPVVLMTACNDAPVTKRIGAAKGKLSTPDEIDQYNDEIEALFGGEL